MLSVNKSKIKLSTQSGAGIGVLLAEIAHETKDLIVVIVPDFVMAFRLEQELTFFAIPIVHFPDWETLPYDNFSPHQDIISQRLAALYHLPNFKQGVLIIPIATLMHRLCPKTYIDQTTFLLAPGDTLDLPTIRRKLENGGYQYTNQVMEHGDFSVRGSILDVFPMGAKSPFRIDLFDNEIESIRVFDPETQRSTEHVQEIKLLPAREYPIDEQAITTFRGKWRDQFAGDPRSCHIYQDVSQGFKAAGLEYYLPLFFDNTATLFDYLPQKHLIVQVGDIENAATEFWQQAQARYDQYAHDITNPILKPIELFITPDEVFGLTKQVQQIKCSLYDESNLPSLSNLQDFINSYAGRILFCAESAGRRVILEELLAKQQLYPTYITNWSDFCLDTHRFCITVAPFVSGAILDKYNCMIITEHELLGRLVVPQHRRKSKNVEQDYIIRDLAELTIDAPVVHIEHGIGRFKGLTTLKIADQEAEFVTLEYANKDKLYVPVTSLQLISRYSGVDIEHAPLHSLGSDKWQREKRKAAQQIRDVAAELLQVYASRAMQTGYALPSPDEAYYKFASEFPFEETIDQQNAINQVIKDLTAAKPMDRVICGDVGFGKTEVAMRAAFLVAQSGKQVAVLVPTTLLAQQHFQTFADRFAAFPMQVESLSRFKNKKEQLAVEQKLANGTCDIVIGTHKLLQNDVKFKDLGLLIIDEEHRFGVQQKERFKALRAQVHILTLTATPIPRTLNMSMSGIRDLSIISTPPAKRLAIKTFVRERNKPLIQEAVNRELGRGGQVYYLHNEVESINRVADELSSWLPTARIAVAHGQMHERELERIMSDFYHRKFNVLVCTTIIETGLDVPTANTIIMDRADKLGLAQLHQLRGRVGRSHHQAYAFCLTPPDSAITGDAKKRLKALEELDTLGAGFILATHDLEIRGAGELLGENQSGNLQNIGFSLFIELLDHAVKSLQSGIDPGLELPINRCIEIDLQVPALIPESYLYDVHSRLVLYKRIANATSNNNLEDLKVEMIDRFGVLPEQVQNLFAVTELKLIAQSLGIKSMKVGSKGGKIEFVTQPDINPDKIVQLVRNNPKCFSFAGSTSMKFVLDLTDSKERLRFVKELLCGLLPNV